MATVENSPPPVTGTVETGKKVLTSDGSIRDRSEPRDWSSLSNSDRERFSVGENDAYTPYWARNSRDCKIWQDDPNDRIEELKDAYPGGEIATDKAGKNIRRGPDLILMKLPRTLTDQFQAEIDAGNVEFEEGLRPVPGHDGVVEKDVRRHVNPNQGDDRDSLLDKWARDREEHARAGMVGGNSPTAGLRLSEAEALMLRKGHDIEAEETFYRKNGRHISMTDEAFEDMFGGAPPRSSKSPVFGVGKGLGRENPNSALNQARRRAAAAQPK